MPIRSTGHYVPGSLAGSRYQAFVPDPLPPQPPLALSSPDLIARKERADQALGRLVRGPGHRAKVLLHCRRFADPGYAALLDPECQLYRELATREDLEAWLADNAPVTSPA